MRGRGRRHDPGLLMSEKTDPGPLDLHDEVPTLEEKMNTPETTILAPTLHLNGSSYERLYELHAEAADVLRIALDKLAEAAPHGRDFYVQEDDAYSKARDQYVARCDRIRSVLAEVEQIMESLTDQHEGKVG